MADNKKTKICFIIFGAYPLFNSECKETFGGAEVDLYFLAKKFAADSNYEISFIVGDYGQKDIEYYEGIKVIKHKYENNSNKNIFEKIQRKIELVKTLFLTNADIYFTECGSELLGWMILIDKYLKRKKVVFRLANDLDCNIHLYKEKSLRFYCFYKFGLLRADWVISQTKVQRDCLEQNLNLSSSVIKNGFFINDEKNVQIEKKKYILWVARGVPIKRPELFIELAERMPEENFILIMPTYEALDEYTSLERKVLDRALKIKNIKHVNFVPFNEIHKYYEEAKIFVNTSEHEGFPNAFIQACLGKTGILSFHVNPDDFITKNNLGYVCNDNIDDAVNFIRNLSEDKIRYYGENAFQYVLDNHNLEKIIKDYKDKINFLCSDR